jgi:Cof subfamily protein (haloacid dehalogenase superfamily)
LTRIQLLAVDVDGTLVTSGDAISAPTRAALHRLRGAEVEVAIATGRRYRNAQRAIDALGLPVPSVCLGGALVKGEDGRTLHARAFDASQFRTVASLFREQGHTVVAQRDSQQGGADFLVDESVPWNSPTRDYHERNQRFAECAGNLADETRDDVLVIGAFGELAELRELERELHRVYPDAFTAHVMPGFFNEGHYCEVVPSHVSKWAGLERLADLLGISRSEICAVGDERNDLSMISAAGMGVAMGNACEELKQAADWVTGRHDEDGLVGVVERILEAKPSEVDEGCSREVGGGGGGGPPASGTPAPPPPAS